MDECCVCLEPLNQPAKLQCGHRICNEHVKGLTKQSKIRCPLCRNLSDISSVSIDRDHKPNIVRRPTGDVPVILVVGPTGSGKSTLINNYSTGENATIGHSLQSETSLTTRFTCNISGFGMYMFDTPGVGDTQNRDQEFLDAMFSTMIHACSGIHHVFICIQVTEARANSSIKAGLGLLINMLGGSRNVNRDHITLVLTKADLVAESYWNPNGDIERRKQEWSSAFESATGTTANVIIYGKGNERYFENMIPSLDRNKIIKTSSMKKAETIQKRMENLIEEKRLAERQMEEAKTAEEYNKAELEKLKADKRILQSQLENVQDLKREMERWRLEARRNRQSSESGWCLIL